jgi:Raf kinase inhibitor-like YbhB/YbcL family protein
VNSRDRVGLFTIAFTLAATLAPVSCRHDDHATSTEDGSMAKNQIVVSSTSFESGKRIPKTHAYAPEGQNVSPAVAWSGVPAGAKELALICDDPDAPQPKPWVHWVVFKIPASASSIGEGAASSAKQLATPAGALQGSNSWHQVGWGGPLPPEGSGPHHYHFKVMALDAPVALAAGATKDELLAATKGHVVAEGEVVGTYER